MAAARTLPDRTQRVRSAGVRSGRLVRRRTRSEPARGPWPGDVSAGLWYTRASLPAWINGIAPPRAMMGLLIVSVGMVVFAGTYALMELLTG